MNNARIKSLRAELEAERIDLAELAEIEDAFAKLPDSALRDRRENATASDMLDELEAHTGEASMSTPRYTVSPDPDQPGRFYFTVYGEGSDVSYDSRAEAESAALAALAEIDADNEGQA